MNDPARSSHPIFKLEAPAEPGRRYRIIVTALPGGAGTKPATIAGLAFRVSSPDRRIQLLGALSHTDILLTAGVSTSIEIGVADTSIEELTLTIDDISWQSYGEVMMAEPVTLRAPAPKPRPPPGVPAPGADSRLPVQRLKQPAEDTGHFDIVLSYAREDTAVIRGLRAGLAAAGYSVWYDADIAGGENYRNRIRTQIDAAKAVVVLWSKSSVKADWVIAEASRAHSQGKLVPLRLLSLTTAEVPDPFGVLNTLPHNDLDALKVALGRKGVKPA